MVYGGVVPVVRASYAGFVNGDGPSSLTAAPACSTTATSSSPAAAYPTTCIGAADPNYLIDDVPGTVSVGAALLTVTATNQTMQAGATEPALTATITGFVNGQTIATSDVTGQPNCVTTATLQSPPGTYPINCSTGSLASTDYQFSFVSGQLTVSGTTNGLNLCNVKGRLTIGPGQADTIGPGCVVRGDVIVQAGGSLTMTDAVLHGRLLDAEGGTLRICGSHLDGALVVYAAKGSVVLGDEAPDCPADSIEGQVIITSNHGPVTLRRAQIRGSVVIELNIGGVTVVDNVVHGWLIVSNNAAPVMDRGNRTSSHDR
jgi:hypothetical protein